ncbi:hypothetical protein R1sor_014785 [Riccia sorocarpa]|uniref:Mannosylglycerate hydrolase MGH1-like glycoside hydrolase domain-containing protein n=1 Tax=Riccia sorocarpa TaxID=122646 RepID=A0ABD3HC81_9MARC
MVNLASKQTLREDSINVLKQNDYGTYTVPALGLYPFQWNWDTGFVAAGWAVYDVDRAWTEIETLFAGQWADGMIPSILFWKPSDTYFPGPEIWGTKENPSNSTGISQPPIAAVIVRYLYEYTAKNNPQLAREKISTLFPKLLAYHRWWYKARDPLNTGLVAILHPWESGMDNSPAWDDALKAFPVGDIPPYERQDTKHVNASMRPSKDTYDHYLSLLYRPFSCENQLTGKLVNARISGAFLPLFAGVATEEQAAVLASTLQHWLDGVKYGVPSADPFEPQFDPIKYWSGPLWININWMISSGLRHYGYDELGERIERESLSVIQESGMREYFNPINGEGAGGESFSWTAALYLAWLDDSVLQHAT